MAIGNNVVAIDAYPQAVVTVVATAGGTLLLGKSNDRISALVTNNGANTIFVGNASVTIADGTPIPAGATLTIPGQGILHGIVAAATEEARVLPAEKV